MTTTATTPRALFDARGYVIFRDVLNRGQVETIRTTLARMMDERHTWHLERTWEIPEVAALYEHEPFLNAFRSLFGEDFVLLPEQTALGHYFGLWHRDTAESEHAGRTYHFDADFNMGTAAIYMRDQHPEYAGGLDLLPRTSSTPNWQDADEWVTVPTRAGDMLVFDTRLVHKATTPKVNPDDIPEEYRKSGIYYTVGANTWHTEGYLEFIASRPGEEYRWISGYEYPEEQRRIARERGFRLLPDA